MKKFLLSVGVAAMALSANAANWFCTGQFDGWKTSTLEASCQLTEVETNVYEYTFPADLQGEFLLVPGEVGGAPEWDNKILPNSISNVLVPGEEYYAVNRDGGPDGSNFTVDGTVKNAKLRLDLTEPTDPVILLTGDAEANEYTSIYMVGAFNGVAWDEKRTDAELTANADKTVFTGTFEITGQDELATAAYVKFAAGANIYGGVFDGEGDVVVEGPSNTEMDFVKSGKTFALALGKYTITINLPYNGEAGKITFAAAEGSAIEGVEADVEAAAPVYYNLQGVRVDNAANGLYIVVRGDKAAKEFVR